jgi:hypothetical protein
VTQSNVSARCRRKILMLSSGLILTVITGALGFGFEIYDLGSQHPDFYNPERGALVEARWELSQVSPPAQPADQARAAQQRIRSVERSLAKAQREHPEDKSHIEQIQHLVERLQAADRAAAREVGYRDDLYQTILDDLNRLIASPHRANASHRQHG